MTHSQVRRAYLVLYRRRYDLFVLWFLAAVIAWVSYPILRDISIVTSVLDIPANTRGYLGEFVGLWDVRHDVPNLIDTPKLIFAFVPWLASAIAGYDGNVFASILVLGALLLCSGSSYLLVRTITSIRDTVDRRANRLLSGPSEYPGLYGSVAHAAGALLFALNPWVLANIANPYLISGYAIFPLFLVFVIRVFKLPESIHVVVSAPRSRFAPGASVLWSMFGIAVTFSSMAVFPQLLVLAGVAGCVVIAALIGTGVIRFSVYRREGIAYLAGYLLPRLAITLVLTLFASWYWLVPALGAPGFLTAGAPVAFAPSDSDGPVGLSRLLLIPALGASSGTPLKALMSGSRLLDVSRYVAGIVIVAFVCISFIVRSRRSIIDWIVSWIILFALMICVVAPAKGFPGMVVSRVGSLFGTGRGHSHHVGLDAFLSFLSLAYAVGFTSGLLQIIPGNRYVSENRHVGIRTILTLLLFASFSLSVSSFMAPGLTGTDRSLTASNPSTADESLRPAIPDTLTASLFVASGFAPGNNDIDAVDFEGYYRDYLSSLIRRGVSRNVGSLMSPLAAQSIVYLPDPAYPRDAGFIDDVLGIQRGMIATNAGPGMTVYASGAKATIPRMVPIGIFSPRGLDSFATFVSLTGYDANRIAYIYTHAGTDAPVTEVRPGDFVEADSFDELFLSNLDASYYIPVSGVVEGTNPNLEWADVRIFSREWREFLATQGVETPAYDLDLGLGVVTTVAPRMITPGVRGNPRLIVDGESMQRLGLSFESTVSTVDVRYDLLEKLDGFERLNLAPSYESLGGSVVAVSGPVEVRSATVHNIRLVVTVPEALDVALGFRYFDKEDRDIGYSYIAGAESSPGNRRSVIEGDIITPVGAATMRLEMLASRVPSTSTRVWVHGISLFEIENISRVNDFQLEYSKSWSGATRYYVRVYESARGGSLDIEIGSHTYHLDTTAPGSEHHGAFRWVELGVIDDQGPRVPIRVISRTGLQAVNAFAAIPVDDETALQFPVRKAIDRGHLFFSYEAESEFDFSGHLQSTRTYPDLSGGGSVSASDGRLRRTIEILDSGLYQLLLRAGGNRDRSSIVVRITDPQTGKTIERNASLGAALPPASSRPVVIHEDESGSEVLRLESHHGALPDLQNLILDPVYLAAGTYNLEIALSSRLTDLISIYGIAEYDASRLPVAMQTQGVSESDCSPCEEISGSMVSRSVTGNVLTMKFTRTCSCEWYIVSSPKIGVEERDEYLVRFDVRTEVLRDRRVKALFLDENDNVIGDEDIPVPSAPVGDEWVSVEHIVEIPRRGSRMLFQVWGRGDRVRISVLELRNLSILPYKELPFLDVVYGFETDAFPTLAGFRTESEGFRVVASRDGMRLNVESLYTGPEGEGTYASRLVDLGRNPSPYWRLYGDATNRSLDFRLNGVSAGLFVQGNAFELRVVYRWAYYLGMALILTDLLIVLLLQWFLTVRIETRRRVYASISFTRIRNAVVSWKKRAIDTGGRQ